MSKVILDAETAAKIAGQINQVELCDPNGNVIGYALPVYEDLSHVQLPGPDPMDDAAIAELMKGPLTGRPTADVIRTLRNL